MVTGDPQQTVLYYSDTEAQNAINEAMSEVSTFSTDERVLSQLNYAMQLRDRLSITEDYAMRLKVEAMGDNLSNYPKKLQEVQLLPADMQLSYREQDEKARSLLFDIDYESTKNEITLRITRSMEVLISNMLTKQNDSSDHMLRVLYIQHFTTAALILSMMVLVVIVFTMVILPLRRAISKMSQAEKLGEEGADEIRFLAHTYNQLHEQNRQAMEKLNHRATHDELTGVYNRSAYASMLESMTKDGIGFALLVLDVDLFKHINDQYGHESGDAVLKLVAETVSGAFRKEDMVCRIGGDEFAVIMNRTESDSLELICQKLRKISEKLSNPGNDLPPVTLSVGIAFTDRLIPDKGLFKTADLALYRVKNSGRNGFGFLDSTGSIEIISAAKDTTGE